MAENTNTLPQNGKAAFPQSCYISEGGLSVPGSPNIRLVRWFSQLSGHGVDLFDAAAARYAIYCAGRIPFPTTTTNL